MTQIKSVIGTQLEEAFSNILQQLQIETSTPAERQAVLNRVRQDLDDILPDGNWQACTTREQFIAEFERLKKVVTEDPGASLRNAIREKQNKK